MSSSELLVNHDEKLASDVEENSNKASYTDMVSDPNKDSNKALYTEIASDSKNNSNNASYSEIASDSEKDSIKASFTQEDSKLANHTGATSTESEELLNEGMLKDFKTDFQNTYDPHFQTFVCDCGSKSKRGTTWRAAPRSFVSGLWTGNKPSKLAKGLFKLEQGLAVVKEQTGYDYMATWGLDHKEAAMESEGSQDLKASYTDEAECLDKCYSECSPSASYNPLSKYNMARCVKVNDFSCLVHTVVKASYAASARTVVIPILDNTRKTDTMVLANTIGGDSKSQAAENCAKAAGFKDLNHYFELTKGEGSQDRKRRFEDAVVYGRHVKEAGSMIVGISIEFFPWETAGTKWDYSAPFFQCVLDADRTHADRDAEYTEVADWIVPDTVKDAECVCWKGCINMGRKNAFCSKWEVQSSGIRAVLGMKPSSDVAPSELASQHRFQWEHESERPTFPKECYPSPK